MGAHQLAAVPFQTMPAGWTNPQSELHRSLIAGRCEVRFIRRCGFDAKIRIETGIEAG